MNIIGLFESNSNAQVFRAWDYRFVLFVLYVISFCSGLRLTYKIGFNAGLIQTANLPECGLGGAVISNPIGFSESHLLFVTLLLVITTFTLMIRRTIGLLFSLLTLGLTIVIYAVWFIDSQHRYYFNNKLWGVITIPLDGADGWDLLILIACIILFVWVLKTLMKIRYYPK